MRVQGSSYYPTTVDQCDQVPSGFCSWAGGQTHTLVDQDRVWVENWDTLSFDVEEDDEYFTRNRSTTISLGPDEWFVDTPKIYSLKVAAEYSAEVSRSVCIGGNIGSVHTSIKSCSEWIDVADNYVFHLKVTNE